VSRLCNGNYFFFSLSSIRRQSFLNGQQIRLAIDMELRDHCVFVMRIAIAKLLMCRPFVGCSSS